MSAGGLRPSANDVFLLPLPVCDLSGASTTTTCRCWRPQVPSKACRSSGKCRCPAGVPQSPGAQSLTSFRTMLPLSFQQLEQQQDLRDRGRRVRRGRLGGGASPDGQSPGVCEGGHVQRHGGTPHAVSPLPVIYLSLNSWNLDHVTSSMQFKLTCDRQTRSNVSPCWTSAVMSIQRAIL